MTDTYRNIILDNMKKWAWDNRRDINKGVYLKKKTIDSIISLRFNIGGCVAQYTMAKQGISILAFRACSMQETETLKAQELAKERTVATRSYEEALKIAKTMVYAPALTYQDMKLNICTFCTFLWMLFGDGCNYYVEVMKVLRILELEDAYAMCNAYTPEVCCRIIWVILHEGRRFFDKKFLSMAFTLGRAVEYPICLLNILDKVYNADIIQRLMYPLAWINNVKCSRQGHPPGLPNVPPPASWTLPATPVQAGAWQSPSNAANPSGGKQQNQGGDSHHPCIKALMDPYLSINTGRLNMTQLLEAANKRYEDLPILPNYTHPQGRSSICWNWVLGRCNYGQGCVFQCGQDKCEDVMDMFADTVCYVLGKGVLHLIYNSSTNAPPPRAVNKQKVAAETGASEE